MILTWQVFAALVLILLRFLAAAKLDSLNARSVRENSDAVPGAFKGIIDEKDYFKSVRYTLEKIRYGIFESAYSSVILALIFLFGIFPILFGFFTGVFGMSVWGQALAFCLVTVIVSIPDLPLDWYEQFVLEQKFGFNKSTLKLWISDKIKETIVGLVIGVLILALILWLFGVFASTWWIWAFVAISLFQIVMLVLYPKLILPLFNKLSPLEDGELKTALLSMADRAGFKANSIFVIDGSKRSSHSNAFFTGFGKFRKIVLYDTLISQLTTAEIEAVLAHEIGHYKLGHVPKMIVSSFLMMFIGFAVLGYLAKSEWFYEGFGFEMSEGMAPVLLLFTTLAPFVTFWLSPVFNAISRKYEYQADAFARKVCGTADTLVSALRKLHTKNLGNLTPHKLYSAFHYSHPTLLERQEALRKD